MRRLCFCLGVLGAVCTLTACADDGSSGEVRDATTPLDASGSGGRGSGGHGSGGHGSGGRGSGGADTGGAAGGGAGGRGQSSGGASSSGQDGGDAGGSTGKKDASSDAGHAAPPDAAVDASSGTDGSEGGTFRTFEISIDTGMQFVDTAALAIPGPSGPIVLLDQNCQPLQPLDERALTGSLSGSTGSWRIPVSSCGVEFLFQIFPSYPHSYVRAPQSSALRCSSHLDNEVGPYFDCTANTKDAVTRIELTSSQTALTGAGPDLATFVH